MGLHIGTRAKAYLMEAAGLGGFVLLAGLLTIFLEHPQLPAMQSFLKHHAVLRRVPLGILLGLYVWGISKLFSKVSGAHINPAVTWTFYGLGNISVKDALAYTLAQFAGAVASAMLLKLTLYPWFSHPLIHFGITRPIPPHNSKDAFIAEFIISFILMFTILLMSSFKKWEQQLPTIMGMWIAVFLVVELPYSGMSLNPARSFAGALAANQWAHLWIYFISPLTAMWLAAMLYKAWRKSKIKKDMIHTQTTELQRLKTFPVMGAEQ